MIPRFDVVPIPEVPATATHWAPDPARIDDCGELSYFHDTAPIVTDIDEATAVLQAEFEALEYLDARSSTPLQFDDLASAIEFEAPDTPSDEAPDFFDVCRAWYGLNELEIGVAGVVHALNAVGIVTAASCRSHSQDHRPWSDYPIVVVAADSNQVAYLQPLVESTGCGFEIDDVDRPHLIALVAPSIVEMMNLARAVLLRPPPLP